jgi:hypothetical protein
VAAEIAYTLDPASLTPAEQQLIREVADWSCLCADEVQWDDQVREHWRHSLSCALRRIDGSLPPRFPPNPILREAEPEPEDGELPPVPDDRPGKIEWAKQARAQGMTYAAIGQMVGKSQAQAYQWVHRY